MSTAESDSLITRLDGGVVVHFPEGHEEPYIAGSTSPSLGNVFRDHVDEFLSQYDVVREGDLMFSLTEAGRGVGINFMELVIQPAEEDGRIQRVSRIAGSSGLVPYRWGGQRIHAKLFREHPHSLLRVNVCLERGLELSEGSMPLIPIYTDRFRTASTPIALESIDAEGIVIERDTHQLRYSFAQLESTDSEGAATEPRGEQLQYSFE